MDALAGLYRIQDKLMDAEPLMTKAVDGRRRVLGEQNPDTLASLNGVALLYLNQGKYSQADALFTKVLEDRRRVLGGDHLDTARVLQTLGRMRLEQQRYAEAETLLGDALTSQEKKSPDSWERYNSQSMLGASLAGQRKYVEAELLLLSGYQGLLQRQASVPWENQSAISQAGERIVQLYQDWAKAEKAAEWQEKLRSASAAGRRTP
jgi:tetratricopeptide (TPR) repeat protein